MTRTSVLACILTGEELGLGPMQSLRMVNVIEGRPAASAELMRALVNRAGHRLSVVDATVDRVTLHGQRRDTGAEARVTWTMQDATRAKLTTQPGMGQVPALDAARPGDVGAVPDVVRRRDRRPVHAGRDRCDRGPVYEPERHELVDPVTDRPVLRDDPDDTEDEPLTSTEWPADREHLDL